MKKTQLVSLVMILLMPAISHAAAPQNWTEFFEIETLSSTKDGFTILPKNPATTYSNVSCNSNYLHIFVNRQSLDIDAVNRMYSTSLSAYIAGKKIAVNYGIEGDYCYGSQVRMKSNSDW